MASETDLRELDDLGDEIRALILGRLRRGVGVAVCISALGGEVQSLAFAGGIPRAIIEEALARGWDHIDRARN